MRKCAVASFFGLTVLLMTALFSAAQQAPDATKWPLGKSGWFPSRAAIDRVMKETGCTYEQASEAIVAAAQAAEAKKAAQVPCCGNQFVAAQKADDKTPAPAKKRRATGRKAPKGLAAIHAAQARRLKAFMAKLPKATAPSFDCRKLGLVPPIVDQGDCGSCWDFSGTGMVTSAAIRAGLDKADGSSTRSEQYTLDCGQNGGCDGDDNTTVLAWAKAVGLPSTKDYGPYKGASGQCRYTTAMPLVKIDDWGFASATQSMGVASVQDIKNAMVQFGPIGSAIAASDDGFQSYTSGVFKGNNTDIDHDIILVGWDDTVGGGVWILRNSWSENWGDKGYMQIAYGANMVGTEAVWCTINAAPAPPPTPPPGPGPGPMPPGPTPPPTPPVPPLPGDATLTIPTPLAAGTYNIVPQADYSAMKGQEAAVQKAIADLQSALRKGKK